MAQHPALAPGPRAEGTDDARALTGSARAEVLERARDLGQGERLFAWFAELPGVEPGPHAPFFEWLAREADRPALKWFVAQEIALRRGVPDQLALTQAALPLELKPHLAVSLWEEMGQGVAGAMPTVLAGRLATWLGEEPPVGEAVEIAEAGAHLARGGRTWQAVGFLGASELTVPGRATFVDQGLQRLDIPRRVRAYFARNARVDRRRARRWVREIVRPAVHRRPEVARYIAEGALCRLVLGARLWARCASELVPDQAASSPSI